MAIIYKLIDIVLKRLIFIELIRPLSVIKIMKLAFIFVLTFYSIICQSQTVPEKVDKTSSMDNIMVGNQLVASKDYFKSQVQINPKNADNWYNYFISVEQSKDLSLAERKLLQLDIFNSSSKFIKGSWQYSLFTFIESGKRDSSSLFNALNLTKDKTSLYPYVIQYSIIKNNKELLMEYAKELNKSKPLSSAIFEYHYNTLMSAGKDAVIYAKGLNDIAPLAILQVVYNIRDDIKLKYFEGDIPESENAYLCLSLGKEIISSYSKGVYAGLLVKLNNLEPLNELDIQNSFKFSILKNLENLSDEEKQIYRNYLPSFIILYKKLSKENSIKAHEWKVMLEKLALVTGMKETVDKLLNNTFP